MTETGTDADMRDKLREAFALIDGAVGGVMDFAGPVPEVEIDRAQVILGVVLPSSYRAFLARYGEGWAGASEIHGLLPGDPDPGARSQGFVGRTLWGRRYGMPADMVAIYNLGNGEDYVLDLSTGTEPILLAWSAGAGGERAHMDWVDTGFPSFLLDAVRRALEEASDAV